MANDKPFLHHGLIIVYGQNRTPKNVEILDFVGDFRGLAERGGFEPPIG
jgi:hypothetical protein